MLTRIEIDGFKTFQDFSLDVPPFLVVLGRNAAGKSNLLDAVAFLGRLAQGRTVMQAVRAVRGGLAEVLHRDDAERRAEGMTFAVELAADGDAPSRERLRYELELRSAFEDPADPAGTEILTVAAERWFRHAAMPGAGTDGWVEVTSPATAELVEGAAPSYPYPSPQAFRPEVGHAGDGRVALVWEDGAIAECRRQIAAWRVLALEPSSLRRADRFEDEDRLTPAGEHLPNTLNRVVRRTKREDRPHGVLNDIVAELHGLVPEVTGVRLDDDRVRRLRSVLVRTKGRVEYSADTISDGTLRALALVTALRDPDEVGMLCLEEPENGIYPLLLSRFVRRLVAATGEGTRRQVLLTSHSPAVLAALPPPGADAVLRSDVVFLDTVSRVTELSVSRVTRARRVRTGRPLPRPLAEPVVSLAEVDEFLGREAPV